MIITDKYNTYSNEENNGWDKVIKDKTGKILGYTKTRSFFKPVDSEEIIEGDAFTVHNAIMVRINKGNT